MPKFEVRVSISYQFDAKDEEEARWLVENGEMPRDREVVGARVADVSRIVTGEEIENGAEV